VLALRTDLDEGSPANSIRCAAASPHTANATATARAIFTSPPPIITLPHIIINAMGEQEQAKQHAAAARRT
jgi:hypothetical protein